MMNRITPVVKHLLIIIALFFAATLAFKSDTNLVKYLALYYPGSPNFQPYQLVTYLFMHSTTNFFHIIFNMYALWLFGTAIENDWGGKRFFIYYFFTGVGAAVLHIIVMGINIHLLKKDMPVDAVIYVYENGAQLLESGKNYLGIMGELNIALNIPTVGASGAVYGILLAFGMMYPNAQLMLLIPPIPIKAKWLVIGYGALALILGLSQPGSNIAHFAHLGGMLFGFILIKYWIAQNKRRY